MDGTMSDESIGRSMPSPAADAEFEQFVAILKTVFDSIVEFDLERQELVYRFSRFLPSAVGVVFSYDDFVSRTLSFMPEEDDRRRLVSALESCQRLDGTVPVICRYQHYAFETTVWCETTFVRVSEGKVLCCVNDVTDRVRAEHERAWTNERYRVLNELTSAASFDYDCSSDTATFYFARAAACRDEGENVSVISRYRQDWPENRCGIIHPDDVNVVTSLFERTRHSADIETAEYRSNYFGEGYRWYRGRVLVSYDSAGGRHIVGSLEDVQDAYELRYRAERDSLTGLLNHAAIQDCINEWLATRIAGERGVCVVLDLDNFKTVNDVCGHLYGDEVLQRIGKLLQRCCPSSTPIGRAGGDEFVVFLRGMGLDDAMPVLETIRAEAERLSHDVMSCAEGVRLSASIGATETVDGDRNNRDVILRSDQALYDAKRAGRNCVRVRTCRA